MMEKTPDQMTPEEALKYYQEAYQKEKKKTVLQKFHIKSMETTGKFSKTFLNVQEMQWALTV